MKKRRGYLKHYNDATTGSSIGAALVNRAYFEVILFWAILERANQLGVGDFEERLSYFIQVLRVTRPKLERKLVTFCSYFDQISIKIQSDFVQISISNYAEYQETRGGKRESKQEAKTLPLKIKDKRLKIKDNRCSDGGIKKPPFRHPKNFEEFKGIFPQDTINAWAELYPDTGWINSELHKAYVYFYVNKSKLPSASMRGWVKRMGTWLDRGWDARSKAQVVRRDFGTGIVSL